MFYFFLNIKEKLVMYSTNFNDNILNKQILKYIILFRLNLSFKAFITFT